MSSKPLSPAELEARRAKAAGTHARKPEKQGPRNRAGKIESEH